MLLFDIVFIFIQLQSSIYWLIDPLSIVAKGIMVTCIQLLCRHVPNLFHEQVLGKFYRLVRSPMSTVCCVLPKMNVETRIHKYL